MEIRYEHNKTKDEAYKIINKFLHGLEKKYKDDIKDSSKKWDYSKTIMDFSLNAKGRDISGNIQLHDHSIVLEVNVSYLVGLALKPMIKKELEQIL